MMSEFNQNLQTYDILLVEDESDLLEALCDLVKDWGYSFKFANSYEKALEQMLSFRFKLVISDINLPQKSGVDLLKWVKVNTPVSRVILMTGFLDHTDIHNALDLGVFGFLAKPVSRKELKKIIKNSLGQNPEDKISDIDFARVDIDDFLSGKILNFPVYIRLKDGRFLKVAHSGVEIDLSRLKLLKEKDIQELWIDKEDLPAYLQLNKKILSAKLNWSAAAKVRFLNHMCEITHESMRLLCLSNESIRYSFDSLAVFTKHMANIRGTMPFASPYLEGGARGSKLAVLGASYSLVVAKILDWTSSKTLFALALGAFFRDVSLTQEGFDFKCLQDPSNDYNREEYFDHPNRSRGILESIKGFPADALTIIEQHHENGGAQSFPNKLPRNKVFQPALLVAHVETMLQAMLDLGNIKGDALRETVLRRMTNTLSNQDEIGTALLLFLKHGDVDHSRKEFERLKKLGAF